MADEKIVTSIVANSDFSNLIADVQRVTASLSRLQQEVAGSNRALSGQIDATNAMFKESMLKTGQFSSHFVSLTSDVEKFGKNLDSGRLKLRDYFRVYQEHARTSGGLIRDLAKQQVQMQNAVLQPLGKNAQGLMQYNVHIPRGLDLTKNKTSILKQELQIMNKVIQDGGVQLINWGKNTQWAGRQLTVGLTLPLAAFGKAAADAFKQADQELTRLTKVYGDIAGASSQDLTKIRNEVSATAKELSSAMGVSFTETIGLAADIAATGKTGNELLASVSETTRLAVLGEVDRQEAMKATLAIQSAFKQNTEELSDTINFLNAVENQTSTTLNDLVEAIPKAGPIIKGLGGSVQDLALYLTAMREGGVNASEGANALKSALASLINPTDVAVAKFQSFGIDLLGIVNKNAGDVTGTLLALQSALDTLNPLQKQQAIEQLFGKFQFSRLNALFENLGRQGSQTLQVLDLMKASAGELEAVAGRELAAVTESASGRYRRAVEGLKAELAGVGDEFLDIGTKLINVLGKIIDFTQKLPDPIKKVLAFGGAFTAILGPVIMLTGVLANFFGYIIKGLGHFKALFKGAEGFKLLTPEIMAARAASSQLADEFYSDAAAADTLRIAIKKLNNDLVDLRSNATSIKSQGGAGQVISTVAGTPIMTMGGGRVVDPTHPLLGGESRAAAHLNPRDPRNPSTIFGLTMQPIPVNRRLGRTPQMLMTERLPDIEGLTSSGGISTGVVAGEHARYAALMATLGVQSRQEIEQLKKTIGLGGQVSKEFIDTFDDILPITQRLSQNAATQSAAIVAELRAGKINVEQARAQIIAVNAQLERMMGTEVAAYAASRGRTIDLTKAPLIDQPVVDTRGKPNTRGMFRTGIFSKVMSALGRATRTRTLGGPYSIETTKPQGLNAGGSVVPGPNVNSDVVPAMLTPGEFVVNREATAANLPLLMAINGNRQASANNMRGGFMSGKAANAILSAFGVRSRSQRPARLLGNWGMLLPNLTNQRLARTGALGAELRMFAGQPQRQIDLMRFLRSRGVPENEIGRVASRVSSRLQSRISDNKRYTDAEFGNLAFSVIDQEIVSLETAYPGIRLAYQRDRMAPGRRDTASSSAAHGPSPSAVNVPGGRGSSYGSGRGGDVWAHYSDSAFEENIKSIGASMGYRFNLGGMVPGYQRGGIVGQMAMGTLGYMGGSSLGGQIGGETGSMVGGMLGSMAPIMMGGRGASDYSKSILLQTRFGASLGANAAAGGKLASTLSKVALGITKTNLALGIGTAAVVAGYKAWQNYQENLERTRASFGLTADSAGKLGLKFTDYNTKIKDTLATMQIMVDRNRALYEGMTRAAVPFNITITEYKKLRKEVKATMADQIDLINNTKDAKLGQLATQLKTQFVAAGMSAEEASKKIYVAFTLSNKARNTSYLATLGNRDFSGITNAQTAAVSSVKQFNLATTINDAKTQANALNTALTAVDSGINEIIKSSEEKAKKDKSGKTQALSSYQAEKQMLDQIKSQVKDQTNLTQGLIDELAKQNPEIKKFASTQDNVISLFQKMRIVAAGFTGDLNTLSQAATNALYQMTTAITSAVQEYSKKDILKDQYNKLQGLIDKRKELISAAKGQSVQEQINSREVLKNINKQIDAIRKEAEERKKALREQQQDEDVRLQLQQKQLEYQDAIATGNMSNAAQLQLEIERLVNEQQLTLTERAIDEEAARKTAPLEARRTSIEEKNQKLADKAALAADKLDDLNKSITDQENKIKAFNDALTAYTIGAQSGVGDLDKLFLAVRDAANKIGVTSDELGTRFGVKNTAGTGRTLYPEAPHDAAMAGRNPSGKVDISQIIKEIGLSANTVYLNAAKVFNEEKNVGSRPVPAPSSLQIAGASRAGGGAVLVFDTATGKWTYTIPSRITDQMIKYEDYMKGKNKYASGGLLRGPGTGTSDSIVGMYANGGMVRVSNGEYIINAATVSKLGTPFFDRLNGMKNGGLMLDYNIPRYDDGNYLDSAMAYKPANSSNNALYNINVNLNGSNLDANDVAKAISREMQLREAMNGRVRTIGG